MFNSYRNNGSGFMIIDKREEIIHEIIYIIMGDLRSSNNKIEN